LRARFRRKLLFAGKGQQTFTSGFLYATPDGLLINEERDAFAPLITDLGASRCVVVECKSIDPRIKLTKPQPAHVFQVIVQMGLLREQTKYRPEWAVITYTNASFLDDVIEFAVRFDPAVFENAKVRAAKILSATSADELGPEGWIGGGHECGRCPYAQACGILRRAVPNLPPPEPLDPQFVAEIVDLARETAARRALVDAAVADARDAEHDLKERLRAKGCRTINGDGITVTWSPVKGRPSFDMAGIRDAAAKAGINLSEFETVGDPTDRLTIRADHLGTKPKAKNGEGK
jgi:hypothetical protein